MKENSGCGKLVLIVQSDTRIRAQTLALGSFVCFLYDS
jgi:hypothetical protein